MASDPLHASLGRNLACHRKALELRQFDVAEAAGISRSSLANIEIGNQPVSLELLYRLGKVLGVEDVRTLLPKNLEALVAAQSAGISVQILEPDEGLTDEQRAQAVSIVAKTFTA